MRRLEDDRGVSIAVTHVLTIGITAILISGLMIGASSILEAEKDRGARQSLETVGERLAGEIETVDRLANDSDGVNMTVEHPRRVAGSTYTIRSDSNCSSSDLVMDRPCLLLRSNSQNLEVAVPLGTNRVDDTASASGGRLAIEYDPSEKEITIESDGA